VSLVRAVMSWQVLGIITHDGDKYQMMPMCITVRYTAAPGHGETARFCSYLK